MKILFRILSILFIAVLAMTSNYDLSPKVRMFITLENIRLNKRDDIYHNQTLLKDFKENQKYSVKYMHEILKSSDAAFKCKILWLLGEINDNSSINVILNQLYIEDNYVVKLASIKALSKYNDHRIEKFLISMINNNNDSICIESLRAIGESKYSNSINQLIKYLDKNNGDIKAETVYALTNIGDSQILKYIKRHLNDENIKVIIAITHALGYFKEALPGFMWENLPLLQQKASYPARPNETLLPF